MASDSGADDGEDPWQADGDPWAQREDSDQERPRPPQEAQARSSREDPPGGVYTTVRRDNVEPPPQRIIHDIPPVWNGKNPDTQAEPYLKLLAGWNVTTRTQKTQRGMTILHCADGDLKTLINELDIEQLTSENSGQLVYDYIHDAFEEYLVTKLPQATEECLFGSDGKRRNGEGMLMYIARKMVSTRS